MSEAGVEVFICYSIGEGASILKRMQALGISFKGVYVTVTPSSNNWAKYLQYDGDYVLTPGQWSSDTSAPCVLFGSAQKYNQFFVDLFGQMPDYTAASQTVAGMMLQLALQVCLGF